MAQQKPKDCRNASFAKVYRRKQEGCIERENKGPK
jgi:hypothetical protein